MSREPRNDFEVGLRDLTEDARAGRPLVRQHARAVLVPLGAWLAEDPAGARAGMERLRAVLAPVGVAWDAAVARELEAALVEIERSLHPPALARRDFDWVYVRGARERLAARLGALEALREGSTRPWQARVTAVDARLARAGPP